MSRPTDESTRDTTRGVPASFDLGLHFRNLLAVAIPAALVGLVVGAAAYLLLGTAPTGYQASVVAQVRSADATAGDGSLGQLTAPYIALSTDTGVLDDVKTKTQYPGTATELQTAISVSQASAPALLNVVATSDTPEMSEALAKQIVASMDSAVQASYQSTSAGQVADVQANIARVGQELAGLEPSDPRLLTLQNEYQADREQLQTLQTAASSRLVLLATPISGATPAASSALPIAAVAAIFGAILSAELLSAVNGRFGPKISRAWARRAARKYSAELQYGTAEAEGGLPPGIALSIVLSVAEGQQVLVVRGTDTVIDETTLRGTFSMSVNDAWWLSPNAEHLKLAVVLVSSGAADKEAATKTLAALDEADIKTVLVVQKVGKSGSSSKRETASVPSAPAREEAPLERAAAPRPRQTPRPGPDDRNRHRKAELVQEQVVLAHSSPRQTPPAPAPAGRYPHDDGFSADPDSDRDWDTAATSWTRGDSADTGTNGYAPASYGSANNGFSVASDGHRGSVGSAPRNGSGWTQSVFESEGRWASDPSDRGREQGGQRDELVAEDNPVDPVSQFDEETDTDGFPVIVLDSEGEVPAEEVEPAEAINADEPSSASPEEETPPLDVDQPSAAPLPDEGGLDVEVEPPAETVAAETAPTEPTVDEVVERADLDGAGNASAEEADAEPEAKADADESAKADAPVVPERDDKNGDTTAKDDDTDADASETDAETVAASSARKRT
ncbi:hypothetical protein ACNHUS_06740 [Actinomycetes bacterium M1A6_2h]